MAVVDIPTVLRPTVLRCCASNAEYNDELFPTPPTPSTGGGGGGGNGDNSGRLSCRAAGTTGARGRLAGRRHLLAVAEELGDSCVQRRDTQRVHD